MAHASYHDGIPLFLYIFVHFHVNYSNMYALVYSMDPKFNIDFALHLISCRTLTPKGMQKAHVQSVYEGNNIFHLLLTGYHFASAWWEV